MYIYVWMPGYCVSGTSNFSATCRSTTCMVCAVRLYQRRGCSFIFSRLTQTRACAGGKEMPCTKGARMSPLWDDALNAIIPNSKPSKRGKFHETDACPTLFLTRLPACRYHFGQVLGSPESRLDLNREHGISCSTLSH